MEIVHCGYRVLNQEGLMTISEAQFDLYVRGLRQRDAQRKQRLSKRQEQARQIAISAANVLKSEFAATKVILFGSLAHGAWFRGNSDIDLAAVGIPAKLFWRAWVTISKLSTDIEINLIDLADAKQSLVSEIELTGVEL